MNTARSICGTTSTAPIPSRPVAPRADAGSDRASAPNGSRRRSAPLPHRPARRLVVCCASAIALLATSPVRAAEPVSKPRFDPPPRLATTPAELEARRKEPDFEQQKQAAIQAADPLLATPPVVPTGAGDWYFYYACPDDGSELRPLDLARHQCPKCAKEYADERTVAAYRTILHDRANTAAETLGRAYALSQDPKYAREVRRILVKLADDYASYPARRDRWGRTGLLAPLGGRRYAQSLDEAVGVIRLAKAYDLTRSSDVWSAADRTHVEEDYFRAVSVTLLGANLDINNHQTWFDAGLMTIASVLGDADLVEKVLTMRGGFRDQLARSAGRDGLWYEGALAYHNYALQAMIEIVEAGRRLGLPLHEEPKFRAMIEAPLRVAYPNGQFPAHNDSDYAQLSSFNGAFLWAWKTYRDPLFARAYAGGNAQALAALAGPDVANEPAVDRISRDLPDAGLAILRRGTGPTASCVMLDYGPHGGGHGHYDKLGIVLYAAGREWLLDPGRLTYSHAEYKTWVKHTAAHNTVALGRRSQDECTGRLKWFATGPDWAGCSAEAAGAYFGAVLTRSLVLTDEFLVDRFDVSSPVSADIDWFAHATTAKLEPVGDLPPAAPLVLGSDHGYQHLKDPTARALKGPSTWDFVEGPDKRLRMWLGGPAQETVATATGIGYWINTPAPCLVRRTTGKQATYVAVYDLTGTGAAVRAVAPAALDPQSLTVTTSGGTWTIRFQNDRAEVRRAK